MKTIIQIFGFVFLKISGMSAALQPLGVSCPCTATIFMKFTL